MGAIPAGYYIQCPECRYQDWINAFDPSCAWECFCPKCSEKFTFEPDDDEDADE